MRKLKRAMVILARLALALFLIVAVVHSVLTLMWGRRYESELARIKAAGEPVTMEDVAGQPVPDSENGAVLYSRAFAMMNKSFSDKDRMVLYELLLMQNWERTPKMWADAEREAPRYDALVALTEQAAAKSRCRFPAMWKLGSSAAFPHFASVRELCRVLCAKAILYAHQGQMDDALRCIRLAARLSSSTKDEPALISFLTRVAVTEITLSGLRDIITNYSLTEAQARRAYDILGDIDMRSSVAKALQGERAYGLWMFDASRRYGLLAAQAMMATGAAPPAKPSLGSKIDAYLLRPLTYADGIAYMGLMRQQIELTGEPRGKADHRLKRYRNSESGIPRYAVFTRLIAPLGPRVRLQSDACAAGLAVTRAALAVIACKDSLGRYPSALAQVEDTMHIKLPADPFTGKPLLYKADAKGFVVYSTGPDARDDGGRELNRHRDLLTQHGDIAFRRRR